MLNIFDTAISKLHSRFGNFRFNLALFLSAALIFSGSFTLFVNRGITAADSAPTAESEILNFGYDVSASEAQNQQWQNRLYTPTFVTKINGMWFIVDCWHKRVIWSNDLFAPISNWKVLDGNLAGPHSIAFGNGYYAVEDTDRNAVNFYAFDPASQQFVNKHTIKLGVRPHRIHYVEQNSSFYVLSSVSQEMHKIAVSSGSPVLEDTQKLGFLEGQYTRSFTIVGNEMLFVAGAKKVTKTTYLDGHYNVLGSYYVPPAFYGMNDIAFTGDKYIVTSTLPNAFGVVDSLEDLPTLKDEATKYGFKGRPYYVSQYGNAIVVPEVAEYASVKIFKQDKESKDLTPVTTIHAFGEANEASKMESIRVLPERYLN